MSTRINCVITWAELTMQLHFPREDKPLKNKQRGIRINKKAHATISPVPCQAPMAPGVPVSTAKIYGLNLT